VATAYPKMSKASIEGRFEELRNLFNTYSGALTYLFFFVSIITFLFAEQFVILVSGYQYLDIDFHGIDIVLIVQIFSIYGLLLPIDRMTGVGLDSINKPSINAFKVMIMLTANVVGDLVAIYVFKSIELVAVSTLVFTTIGILVGMYYLNKSFAISLRSIVLGGNEFYRKVFLKIGLIKA
jgi:O-antigen/teichoic acid export membrane protein